MAEKEDLLNPAGNGAPPVPVEDDDYESGKAKQTFVRRATPAFMASLAAHLMLVFVLSLFPASSKAPDTRMQLVTELVTMEEEKPPEPIDKQDMQVKDMEVKSETPKTNDTSEKIEIEEAAEAGFEDAKESVLEAVGATDTPENSMPAIIGFAGGASGGGALPHGYGGRAASGKGKGRGRYGGGGTDMSLLRALQWLANHQEPDGSWDVKKYEGSGRALYSPCQEMGEAITTSIALLAFLGDGHSENVGSFKKTVRDGIRYINMRMDEDKERTDLYYGKNYGSAIMLMALSEACIFGSSAKTRENANRLAEWFVRSHKGTSAGWRYTGAQQSDLSVSGWIALGLKSGKTAELSALMNKDYEEVFSIYKTWVDTVMTSPKGAALYLPGTAAVEMGTQSMAYVGMFQKHFLGGGRGDAFNVAAAEYWGSPDKIDRCYTNERPSHAYMIYYGTLSAFQQQGKFWESWNAVMKRWLIASQCPGDPKDMGGSWDPTPDHCGEQGGRVFVTAMFAMCLEVYYRYGMLSAGGN